MRYMGMVVAGLGWWRMLENLVSQLLRGGCSLTFLAILNVLNDIVLWFLGFVE